MDKSNEQPKKCFCARCFLPIEPEDKVDIEGQNFHRMCSMCCICRQIPTSLKMFYGHVFCNECFKTHVLNRFKGEPPRMHSNSWWMQWAPGAQPQMIAQAQAQAAQAQAQAAQAQAHAQQAQAHAQQAQAQAQPRPQEQCQGEKVPETEKAEEKENEKEKEEPTMPKCAPEECQCKKCICARCLQAVDDSTKVVIGGQSFHPQCCRCCFCHTIPKDNVKIYYGQVFCEECFNRFVLARNKDTPAENLRTCFEQWQNNQFADNMRDFMSGKENANANPVIFMMQGSHPPFCRCGNNNAQPREWFQANEPRKSATPATLSIGEESFGTWDLSFENRDEVSDIHESWSRESANQENLIVAAAEKIEKLTKYLQDNSDSEKHAKKWKNFIEYEKSSMASEMESLNPLYFGWIDLQDPKVQTDIGCPKCLWQCGSIFVNSDNFLQKVVCCEENLSFE